MKLKTAAVVTIKAPGDMTPAGRREIARWLRKQAANLTRDGRNYTTGRFRVRWQYT